MARGFEVVEVANFSSQQSEERHPRRRSQTSWIWDPEEDVFHFDEEDSQPPRIAEWRSNLTAISHHANVYFAAYQDKVHITVPRDLKQTLPGQPDLILELPVSEEAIQVGGYIDDSRPHCVNHLVVGKLGTHEVLLMSCDDGDVLGYYTNTIVTALAIMTRATSQIESHRITPFLHENVGMSSWGLAVHEQSRLIAVSSNRREVTVFVPAILGHGDEIPHDLRPISFPEVTASYKESAGFRRSNTRRVLRLGAEGDNIPSIAFASDIDGNAKSILAIDIQGCLWILEIWGDKMQQIPGPRGDNQMGWGVLCLPLTAFLQTKSPQEALGIPDIQHAFSADDAGEKVETFFDISTSIRLINEENARIQSSAISQDDSMVHSALVLEDDHIGNSVVFMDLDEFNSHRIDSSDVAKEDKNSDSPGVLEEQDEALVVSLLRERQRITAQHNRFGLHANHIDYRRMSLADRRQIETECYRYIVNMPLSVSKTMRSSSDLTTLLEQHIELKSNGAHFESDIGTKKAAVENPVLLIPDGSAVFRAYQFDVELLPPDISMPRTICKRIVKHSVRPALLGLLRFERLCFLALVPELSLIIVGSQAGRAALITITRPEVLSTKGPVVNFRIDLILPREQEDDLRPNLPLFGLAVAPLQDSKIHSGRRWRLIMHYYDHTVLSYELSRDVETEDLLAI